MTPPTKLPIHQWLSSALGLFSWVVTKPSRHRCMWRRFFIPQGKQRHRSQGLAEGQDLRAWSVFLSKPRDSADREWMLSMALDPLARRDAEQYNFLFRSAQILAPVLTSSRFR